MKCKIPGTADSPDKVTVEHFSLFFVLNFLPLTAHFHFSSFPIFPSPLPNTSLPICLVYQSFNSLWPTCSLHASSPLVYNYPESVRFLWLSISFFYCSMIFFFVSFVVNTPRFLSKILLSEALNHQSFSLNK